MKLPKKLILLVTSVQLAGLAYAGLFDYCYSDTTNDCPTGPGNCSGTCNATTNPRGRCGTNLTYGCGQAGTAVTLQTITGGSCGQVGNSCNCTGGTAGTKSGTAVC